MKKCPFCAEEIQDEAIFCRYCKKDLVPKAKGDEEILYHGKATIKGYMFTFLMSLILIFVAGIGFIILLWLFIKLKVNVFKISNTFIDYSTGLFHRSHNSLDVWRIKDIRLKQGIFDRIYKTGTITCMTIDKTHPIMILRGIPNAPELYQKLKIAAQQQRDRKKVTSFELS